MQTAVDIKVKQMRHGEFLQLDLDQLPTEMQSLTEVNVFADKSTSPSALVSIHQKLFDSLTCSDCIHRVQLNTYSLETFFQDSNLNRVENNQINSVNSWVVGVKVGNHQGLQSSAAIIQLAFKVFTEPSGKVTPFQSGLRVLDFSIDFIQTVLFKIYLVGHCVNKKITAVMQN